MKEQEAIDRMRYRIDTASGIAGKGEDDKAFEDMELAVSALEKQVPKKPPYDEHNRAGYRCPNCNNTNPWGYNYCKHCGQRLDWRE